MRRNQPFNMFIWKMNLLSIHQVISHKYFNYSSILTLPLTNITMDINMNLTLSDPRTTVWSRWSKGEGAWRLELQLGQISCGGGEGNPSPGRSNLEHGILLIPFSHFIMLISLGGVGCVWKTTGRSWTKYIFVNVHGTHQDEKIFGDRKYFFGQIWNNLDFGGTDRWWAFNLGWPSWSR